MKTHVICAIRDNKAGIIWQPYLFRNTADFVRQIQMEAKNSNSMLHKFPADYDLVTIGDWSETQGIIGLHGADDSDDASPVRLGSVLDLCPLS